jgi:excisionase family DNA binding protein
MTPRPYKPDPNCQVYYGRWPSEPSEGVIPEGSRYFLENPPDPRRGLTLVKRRGKTRHYKKLKSTDQLSQAEAAAFLHVSRMQLNRWVREGVIPDRKPLGTSRIRVADLVAFARKKGMPFFR